MIIVLAHNKGGVGKTTTALNLTEILKPDIVIDQDAHSNLVTLNSFREPSAQFNVLSGLSKNDLIEQLKQSEQGKLILVDCGGFDSELNRIAVALSDLVIVPANDDITEVIGLKSFDKTLSEISAEMGTPINGRVLFTRVHPRRKKFDDVESFLNNSKHLSRLNTTIPTRKDYGKAALDGMGVFAHPKTKHSDAARDIKALASEINALLNT